MDVAATPAHATNVATVRAALVGNPNCGKSTLFNTLTGGTRATGNWSGVTVDGGAGSFRYGATEVRLVDLPGVYSLGSSSADEEVTRAFLASRDVDLLVNVVDASRLQRNLYLTMQLAELALPMLVVVNMVDTAEQQGERVDIAALERLLGVPVVASVGGSPASNAPPMQAIASAAAQPRVPVATPLHPPLDAACAELAKLCEASPAAHDGAPPAWIARRLLEHDAAVEAAVPPGVLARRDELDAQIEDAVGEEADVLVADARYQRVGELTAAALHRRHRVDGDLARRLDHWALHPRLGIPVFLGVMYVMFMLTVNVGSAFIDFFDIVAGALAVDLTRAALQAVGMPELLIVLLADGVGGGLQSVATFIPIVGVMFACLRVLEESGYMARAAFVMDRWMRALGLPGNAFVPMIVGFGCNVPAIMGARTLERERDRRLAVSMNPFMSCGARLPVYALFAAAFFPSTGQLVVFALYLIGIGFAILTGLVLQRTLLRGEVSPFIMELPPYRVPSAREVARSTWRRVRSFITGAGRIIVPVVVVLTLLSSIGTDGSLGNEDTSSSVLASVGRALTPALSPMGIEEHNWPATVSIITGVFAKEVVIGTLDALYAGRGGDDGGLDIGGSIAEALATIPANLADAARSMLDPLGLSVGESSYGSRSDSGSSLRAHVPVAARPAHPAAARRSTLAEARTLPPSAHVPALASTNAQRIPRPARAPARRVTASHLDAGDVQAAPAMSARLPASTPQRDPLEVQPLCSLPPLRLATPAVPTLTASTPRPRRLDAAAAVQKAAHAHGRREPIAASTAVPRHPADRPVPRSMWRPDGIARVSAQPVVLRSRAVEQRIPKAPAQRDTTAARSRLDARPAPFARTPFTGFVPHV